MRAIIPPALVAVVSLAAAGWVGAGTPLPEGRGLAAKYPGDRGIERDPDVVFAEHFDGSVDAVVGRWEDAKNRELFSLSDDAPAGRSLLMTHVGGKGTGGHLYRRLMPGHERLFARFYVKINYVWAYLYMTGAPAGHRSRVWFDQIVVAKQYVGPIVAAKRGSR